MSDTATEHRLRIFAVSWYLLGWIPCTALNGLLGVPGKICLGLYAALGMVVYMVGMSIARERADESDTLVEKHGAVRRPLDATELERLREIEREYDDGE